MQQSTNNNNNTNNQNNNNNNHININININNQNQNQNHNHNHNHHNNNNNNSNQTNQTSFVYANFILKTNTPIQIIQILEDNKKQLKQIQTRTNNLRYLVNSLSVQNLKKVLFWAEKYIGNDPRAIPLINLRLLSLGRLDYISHIDFDKLENLVLNDCQLMSIEALSWMKYPNLSRLSLINNYFYSLRPLTKTKFSKLIYLNMNNNIFTDNQIKNLTRIHTKNSLTYLYVQEFYGATDKLQKQEQIISNFTHLFKIQSKEIVNTISWVDIHQQKIGKVLQQKLCISNKNQKLIQFIQPTYQEGLIHQNQY